MEVTALFTLVDLRIFSAGTEGCFTFVSCGNTGCSTSVTSSKAPLPAPTISSPLNNRLIDRTPNNETES